MTHTFADRRRAQLQLRHYNRLISGPSSAALAYDPGGRLYEYSANPGGGAVTTRFLYDGAALVAEFNTSNALLRRYVHGPGIDEPILWYERNGGGSYDRNWLVADERGSIIARANDAGAVSEVYSYDEYGNPNSWSGSRFRYTGQVTLAELQLYHYKARVYDPRLGRFLQTDPIGFAGGMNLYAYVGNNPVNATDPLGLHVECTVEYTDGGATGTCRDMDRIDHALNGPGYGVGRGNFCNGIHGSDVIDRCNLGDAGTQVLLAILCGGPTICDPPPAPGDVGRPLNQCERNAMGPYFARAVLDGARIHDHFPFPVAPAPAGTSWGGITLPRGTGGSSIYLGGADTTTRGGLVTLAHELAHATEYASGTMTVGGYLAESARQGSYTNNRHEVGARVVENKVQRDLDRRGTSGCPS